MTLICFTTLLKEEIYAIGFLILNETSITLLLRKILNNCVLFSMIFSEYLGLKKIKDNDICLCEIALEIKFKWLSRGIGDIRSVITYPGLINPTLPYHLIILVGFESERTSLLIENFDTTMVSLGLGYTEIASANIERMGEISEQNHKEIANRFPNVFTFKFSLDNPLKTSEDILNHISKFPGTNSIIAPMSNKISTVGTALAYFANQSIQICYASANQYNVNYYSIPSADCILFQLDI